jgi:hypothetical protein
MQSSSYIFVSNVVSILVYVNVTIYVNCQRLRNYAELHLKGYRLPDANICLLVGSNSTNSVVSAVSPSEILPFAMAIAVWCFKLSLDECIEFTILGLKTIVVHGLLSFYHLEKYGQSLRQRLQQRQ